MAREKIGTISPKLLLAGPASVTLFLVTQGVTDPVNATKFFLLGGVALALFFSIADTKTLNYLWKTYRNLLIALSIFFFASVNSLIQSNAPLTQSLYGVYGRNNGFFLYVFLTLTSLAVLTITTPQAFKLVIYSLVISGVVNVIYCLWVVIFGDFIGWNNPYGNILGTFGNPNFIGAFLGMFSSVLITGLIYFRKSLKITFPIILVLFITLFEIFKSNAIQGRVLFIAGCGINFLFYLWFYRKKTWILVTSFILFILSGLFGILGALQIGPLKTFVYKDSVSLRGEYWFAGIQMGVHNLFSGVGFDAYGDWYRFFRRPSALIRPGIDTVSNTAHNVYIDIFAFGGAPLLLSYLMINVFVAISIFKVIRRREKFDFSFVAITGAWLCYQLQSVISINQVGLALWGWVLGAALIAYERSSQFFNNTESRNLRKQVSREIITPNLRAGIGFVIGLMIAVPPISADMKWRSAQLSRDAVRVELSLKSGYMNPNNSVKYLNTVGLFHESGLDSLAHKYALEATKFNRNNFESWRSITYIRNSNTSEKELAFYNMHRLDPLNPNINSGTK